jgi:hypothetical protein
MRNFLIASTAALTVLATGAIAQNAQTGGRPFTATLTGAAEVPGPGDPDGSGQARVTVNPGTGDICYVISVSGIAPATAAHIHEAPEGESGGVVLGLTAPTGGSSSGCLNNKALAVEILRNPEDYYVNVHNAEFRNGAVRGQLGK